MEQKHSYSCENPHEPTVVVNVNEDPRSSTIPATPPPQSAPDEQDQNWLLKLLKQFVSLFLSQVSESKVDTFTLPSPKTKPITPSGRRRSFSKLSFAIILLLIGGFVGYILSHTTSSPTNVDLIRHVTIELNYVKSDPNPPLRLPFLARGIYFCDVSYPVPGNPSFKEVLEDFDEGTKNNTADVYQQCFDYSPGSHTKLSGDLVTLIVSGYRDQATSSFRNILQIIPE